MLLETCALAMVLTFGWGLGGFLQCLLSATLLAVLGMLLLAVKPFKCPAAGRVAVLSVCVLFFTAQVALSFIKHNSASPGPVYGSIMGALILLANVAFLLGTTWQLVTGFVFAGPVKTLRRVAHRSAGLLQRRQRQKQRVGVAAAAAARCVMCGVAGVFLHCRQCGQVTNRLPCEVQRELLLLLLSPGLPCCLAASIHTETSTLLPVGHLIAAAVKRQQSQQASEGDLDWQMWQEEARVHPFRLLLIAAAE